MPSTPRRQCPVLRIPNSNRIVRAYSYSVSFLVSGAGYSSPSCSEMLQIDSHPGKLLDGASSTVRVGPPLAGGDDRNARARYKNQLINYKFTELSATQMKMCQMRPTGGPSPIPIASTAKQSKRNGNVAFKQLYNKELISSRWRRSFAVKMVPVGGSI